MNIVCVTRSDLDLLLKKLDQNVTPRICQLGSDNRIATLFLSERNVRALLSKLDRVKAGEQSARTIIKYDTTHAKCPCSAVTSVTAVETDSDLKLCSHITEIFVVRDDMYYTERAAGPVHPADL